MIRQISSLLNTLVASSYGNRLRQRAWILGLVFTTQLLLSFSALYHTYSIGISTGGRTLALIPYMLLHSASWGIMLWSLLAYPAKRWSTGLVGSILLLVTIGLYVVEMILFQEYRTLYNVDLALLMLSTNSREAGELFSILHVSSFVWTGIGLLFSGISAHIAQKIIQRIKNQRRLWIYASCIWFVGAFALLPAAYAHMDSRVIPSSYTTGYERAMLSTAYGYLLSLKVEKRYAAMAKLEGLKDLRVENAPFDEPVHIILVLGESTRRDYLRCYGYPLANTPGIDSLMADSSLITFTDVIAPATTTNYSCQRTLTYYTNVEAQHEWYDYPNLLATLGRAGWATAWITNQEATGIYSVSRIFSPFANIVRENYGVNNGLIDTSEHALDDLDNAYDTALLPLLETYNHLPDSLRKQYPRGIFEVVHLMGAHFDYSKRYPTSFAHFSPKDLPHQLGGNKDQIVASYVNSVFFTDYVFTQIANFYSKQAALVIYMSDHGEILYDDPQNPEYFGHNPYMVTPGAIQIPFFVYLSPSLKQRYPDIYEVFNRARHQRISSDLFTHTLTDFLGIKSQYSNSKLNFLSEDYDPSRKRIVTATEADSFEVD